LKRQPCAAEIVWLIASIIRRRRTRLPTLVDGIWGPLADGIHYRFRIEKITYVPTDERAAANATRDQKDCPAQ
jgi:hypothetical protein